MGSTTTLPPPETTTHRRATSSSTITPLDSLLDSKLKLRKSAILQLRTLTKSQGFWERRKKETRRRHQRSASPEDPKSQLTTACTFPVRARTTELRRRPFYPSRLPTPSLHDSTSRPAISSSLVLAPTPQKRYALIFLRRTLLASGTLNFLIRCNFFITKVYLRLTDEWCW